MRARRLCVVLAAAALAASQHAFANTWNVGCPGSGATTLSVSYTGGGMSTTLDFAADPGTDSAPDALGALLGTPTQPSEPTIATMLSAALSSGDTVEIDGLCQQDVTITTPGLLVTNHDDAPTAGNDGDQGQIEVAGARQTVLSGLLLGTNSGTFSFASAADRALLYAHDGASVTAQYSEVVNSSLLGVFVTNQSRASLLDTFISGNGTAATGFQQGVGALASNGSSLVIGSPDTNPTTTEIDSNTFGGIALLNGSTLIATAGTIDTNSGRQIFLSGTSSAHLTGSIVEGSTCPGTCGDGIDAIGSSSLRLDGVTYVDAVAGQSAVTVVGGSTLLLSGANLVVPASTTTPTIEASFNSVVALAGGNAVCSGSLAFSTCTPGDGLAIEIDHVSTLIDVPAADFGYTAGQDFVGGGGSVLLQSTVDLGLGNIPGGMPSLAWNTGGSSGISVAQNSSFRLNGGATITGPVKLSQSSNGFFNITKTGTNTVTAGVSCPFTAIPGAHIVAANSNALSPTPNVASSFLSATPPQCLPF
jgi:hypothetical protein